MEGSQAQLLKKRICHDTQREIPKFKSDILYNLQTLRYTICQTQKKPLIDRFQSHLFNIGKKKKIITDKEVNSANVSTKDLPVFLSRSGPTLPILNLS